MPESQRCAAPDCGVEFIPNVHNQKYHTPQCKRDVENVVRRRIIEDAAPVELDAEGQADKTAQLEEQVSWYRQENNRMAKALDKAKLTTSEMVHTIHNAARQAFSLLELPQVSVPILDDRKKGEEVAVAMVGDWQLGKKTPNYSSPVCEERIELYGDKVIELAEIQRADHPVKDLRVWVLGDIIEGITIFPGQQWLVDSSLYRQIAVDGPRIMGNFLRKMLASFEQVHVTAVIGNHGRLGKRGEYDPESNGDRMLYRIVQQLLADEDRLTWTIPDGLGERHWYAVDTIGNYSSLLIHGDQIRGGFGGFPFYGLAKKVWGWKAGSIPDHFDDVAMGHYHQNTTVTLNNTLVRCIGSTESMNTYAQEQLAAMGEPSQRLIFVHPQKGRVTSDYVVWL